MAIYDYFCDECGPFTEMRPMSQCKLDCVCPSCGGQAPRAILRTPHYGLMDAGKRNAFSTNEQSQHAPKSSKALGHGAGCSCCGGSKKNSKMVYGADGSKMAPSARPWMIGH